MFLAKLSVYKQIITLKIKKKKLYILLVIYNIYSTKLYIYAILYIPFMQIQNNYDVQLCFI